MFFYPFCTKKTRTTSYFYLLLRQNEGLEIDSQTSNPTMNKPTYKNSK